MSDKTNSHHSLADIPELVGFFSYSRRDDENAKGSLSSLRDAIQRELCLLLGRPGPPQLRLWQDKEAIAPGTLWELEIKAAIGQSVFFIPIVTPLSVKSPYCHHEFQAFLERERELGRSDLVFPLLYIRVPELEDHARWEEFPALPLIAARQWIDWRRLRQHNVDDMAVRQAVELFAETIAEKLRAAGSAVPPPLPDSAPRTEAELHVVAGEEQRKLAAVEAQRQAEAERLREGEARRQADAERLKDEEARRVREEEAKRLREQEGAQRRAEAGRARLEDEARRQAEAQVSTGGDDAVADQWVALISEGAHSDTPTRKEQVDGTTRSAPAEYALAQTVLTPPKTHAPSKNAEKELGGGTLAFNFFIVVPGATWLAINILGGSEAYSAYMSWAKSTFWHGLILFIVNAALSSGIVSVLNWWRTQNRDTRGLGDRKA